MFFCILYVFLFFIMVYRHAGEKAVIVLFFFAGGENVLLAKGVPVHILKGWFLPHGLSVSGILSSPQKRTRLFMFHSVYVCF